MFIPTPLGWKNGPHCDCGGHHPGGGRKNGWWFCMAGCCMPCQGILLTLIYLGTQAALFIHCIPQLHCICSFRDILVQRFGSEGSGKREIRWKRLTRTSEGYWDAR